MKKAIINTVILLLMIPLFIFCSKKSNKKAEEEQSLPHYDEIALEYDSSNYFLPVLNATVNDTFSFKVFFDSGVASKSIMISDKWKDELGHDSLLVKIGNQNKKMPMYYLNNRQENVYSFWGSNTVTIGWKFFDKKIIELSLKNKYIRIFEVLPDISEYTKTQVAISSTSYLEIPIEVVLQGKTIKKTAFIDTGHNSYASFENELIKTHGLDATDAYNAKTLTDRGELNTCLINIDTIRVSDLYVAKENMRVTFWPTNPQKRFNALLGTLFLENFSVILDLNNYDLYLKPID